MLITNLQLCRSCAALRDFTGEGSGTAALDLQCGTGGTSFELATIFSQVLTCPQLCMLVQPACGVNVPVLWRTLRVWHPWQSSLNLTFWLIQQLPRDTDKEKEPWSAGCRGRLFAQAHPGSRGRRSHSLCLLGGSTY